MIANLAQVVVSAVAIGVAVRVLTAIWRRVWHVETPPREAGALVGATVALLAVWGLERGPRVAGMIAALVVLGFFVIKLIRSRGAPRGGAGGTH